MRQRQIVITGASGFIGSHILAHEMTKGLEVLALTRSTQVPSNNDYVSWVSCPDFSKFIPPQNSILLHVGEPSHVTEVEARGGSHISAMVQNAAALLCHRYDNIVYASSATVYGDMEDYPRRPDEKISFNHKIYAQGKLEVEKLFTAKGGAVARVTNIYGPGMASTNIISDILAQLPAPGPVQLRETAPIRDYLHIEDLAAGLLTMCTEPTAGIFNLASGHAISCGDLGQLILKLSGQYERQVKGRNSHRNSALRLDISSTLKNFNWKPNINLEDGLAELLGGRRHK